MLAIRLQRVGKKNQASFRVVLQEHSWAPKGKAKEILGFYNPVTKAKAFQKERINYWFTKGAKASPTVHNILVDEGLVEGPKVKAWQPKKKTVSASGEQQTANAPAEGPSMPAQDTQSEPPKEETVEEEKESEEVSVDVPKEEKEVAKKEEGPAPLKEEEVSEEAGIEEDK